MLITVIDLLKSSLIGSRYFFSFAFSMYLEECFKKDFVIVNKNNEKKEAFSNAFPKTAGKPRKLQ